MLVLLMLMPFSMIFGIGLVAGRMKIILLASDLLLEGQFQALQAETFPSE